MTTANVIWRDFVTEGVPASGTNNPAKAAIRVWGTALENVIAAGALSDAVWKATLSDLGADLAHDAGTIGVVYDDSTSSNNGLYKKTGASGSGSWTQLTTFLPGYQFVTATDDGNSTANAWTMDTSPRLPAGDGVALVSLIVPETSTAETVTVSFDGDTSLTVKTASGNNPAAGGLVAGMPLLGVVIGSEFRMRSDQASAAVLAQMEGLLADFEEKYLGTYADDTEATAAAGGSPQEGQIYFNSTAKTFRYWDGDSWETFPNATVADGSITEQKIEPSFLATIARVIDADLTVNIPTDYPTLQDAIDALSTRSVKQGVTITLNIETGHALTAGVLVEHGDYSHFVIEAADATVSLDAGFPAVDIIKGANARMPQLACLIDANGLGVNGYFADQASTGFVHANCGIDRVAQQACYANAGSTIYAEGSLFRQASQAAASYSGILAWASRIVANGADVTGSLYYGAQAAASGVLHFRDGVADGAARHGVRATNGALVNARSASSNNTGVTGFRAFDTGIIHATGSTATGSLSNAYMAQNNGIITADDATCDAASSALVALDNGRISAKNFTSTAGNIQTLNHGEIFLENPTITNTGGRTLTAAFGSTITTVGGSVTGGDGDRALNLTGGSTITCHGTNLTANSTETYLATCDESTLNIFDGTHTYPNSAVNLLNGSFLRLNGSGILAADVPGMANITLSGRGIMWGAS